jgi:6-phosphofructo-2-kinase/fructose-2,6-biphosphatase 4
LPVISPIYAQSGQSSLEHSYRADADLSEAGWEYAERLKDFVIERRAQTLKARNQDPADSRLVIWTSARRRAHHTAWPFIAASQQVGSTFVPNPDPGLHGHGSGYGAAAGTGSVSGPEQTGIPSGFDAPAPPPSAPPEIRTSPTSYLPKSGLPPSISNSRAGFDIPLHAPIPQPIADIRPTHTPLPGGGRPSYAQVPGPGADAPIAMGNPEGMPHVRVKVVEKAQMGEINPGVWDGLNPQQVRKYYPQEWRRFSADPYAYRAPRAESYHDLCGRCLLLLSPLPCVHVLSAVHMTHELPTVRLEPILIELEREQEDLLIIGHASVIRCLLAYLIGLPAAQVPAVEVARGDLIEVVPTSYGVRCQTFHFWDGPGRRHGDTIGKDETNFYENYAEDTKGKKVQVT